jgi:hypothetical protein
MDRTYTYTQTHTNKKSHIHKKRADEYLHSALHGTGDGKSLPAVGDARHRGGALEGCRPGFVGAHLNEAQFVRIVNQRNHQWLGYQAYLSAVLVAVSADASYRDLNHRSLFATSQ